jgi:D-alanyl-D-alanine carboxypeptidase
MPRLCPDLEGGTAAFVARMNQMAAHLGLTNSRYADPSQPRCP